jgi:hypothetical protein
MSEVRKKVARTGPTFSSPTVSLTLYPVPSFRPIHFFRGQCVHTLCLFESHGLHKICRYFDVAFTPQFREVIIDLNGSVSN